MTQPEGFRIGIIGGGYRQNTVKALIRLAEEHFKEGAKGMTQPNEQLISEIEKALEAATPGPWAPCTWDPMERPHVLAVDKQKGTHCDGKADLPLTAEDAYLISMSKDWLRALLEENKHLQSLLEGKEAEYQTAIDKNSVNARARVSLESQLQQTKEELRRVKVTESVLQGNLDAYTRECERLRIELEQVKKERDYALRGSTCDACRGVIGENDKLREELEQAKVQLQNYEDRRQTAALEVGKFVIEHEQVKAERDSYRTEAMNERLLTEDIVAAMNGKNKHEWVEQAIREKLIRDKAV